nr:ABC transporter permease subunit [Bradyrhizobium sp. 137]
MLNTIAAVKQVEPLRITSARTMRAPPQQLSAVILPAALPTIVVGIRLASASVMRVLVASEMVGAKGLFHHRQPVQFSIPQMYPRDYSRRAYVQCHPARDRGTFHAMESAGLLNPQSSDTRDRRARRAVLEPGSGYTSHVTHGP